MNVVSVTIPWPRIGGESYYHRRHDDVFTHWIDVNLVHRGRVYVVQCTCTQDLSVVEPFATLRDGCRALDFRDNVRLVAEAAAVKSLSPR